MVEEIPQTITQLFYLGPIRKFDLKVFFVQLYYSNNKFRSLREEIIVFIILKVFIKEVNSNLFCKLCGNNHIVIVWTIQTSGGSIFCSLTISGYVTLCLSYFRELTLQEISFGHVVFCLKYSYNFLFTFERMHFDNGSLQPTSKSPVEYWSLTRETCQKLTYDIWSWRKSLMGVGASGVETLGMSWPRENFTAKTHSS